MIKNKPYAHVRPGDTLIIKDMWGNDHRYPVVKVETWEEDLDLIKITFPEVKDEATGIITEESTHAVFEGTKQALYEVV
jgi:hypothetical protein